MPDAPIGIPEAFEDHAALMFDLLALAYEADLTRVFTFMKSRDASQRVYPKIGVTEPHHAMSHHGNNPEKLANLVKLNTLPHERCSRSSSRSWPTTPDGDGTLLDHSLILYGSGMSESDTHSRLNIPTLLVGKGAGLLKGNQHIAAAEGNADGELPARPGQQVRRPRHETFGISTGRFEVVYGRTDPGEDGRCGRSVCGGLVVSVLGGRRSPAAGGYAAHRRGQAGEPAGGPRGCCRSAPTSTRPRPTA